MGRIIRPIIVGVLGAVCFFLVMTFIAITLPTAENDPFIIGLGSMAFGLSGIYTALKNVMRK